MESPIKIKLVVQIRDRTEWQSGKTSCLGGKSPYMNIFFMLLRLPKIIFHLMFKPGFGTDPEGL